MMEEDYVLIVDDNVDARQIMEDAISMMGYEVMAVENGSTALEAAAKHPPLLVLLDVMMPGMSGLQVLSRLRGASATREVPVIIVSASTVADIDPRRLPGNTTVMPKASFKIAELQATIRNLLSGG